MKYISLNWTLALKFSIGKKKRMRDYRILMAHDCIWGKSDKKHVPHLICYEDKKQVTVIFWGCVSSRGEEALIPV